MLLVNEHVEIVNTYVRLGEFLCPPLLLATQ